jgi:hypothetical protein
MFFLPPPQPTLTDPERAAGLVRARRRKSIPSTDLRRLRGFQHTFPPTQRLLIPPPSRNNSQKENKMINNKFIYGENVTSVEGSDWIIYSKNVKSKKAIGTDMFFAAQKIVSEDFIGPPIIIEMSEYLFDDAIYNISKFLEN